MPKVRPTADPAIIADGLKIVFWVASLIFSTEFVCMSLENTLWQNTVLASSGFVVACIVYTGKETRSEMNAKSPTMKFGKLDEEVNTLSKFLFGFMVLMSFAIVAL